MSGIITDNVGRSSGLVKSAGGGGVILQVKSMKFTGTASRTGTAPAVLSDFDMSFASTTSDGKLCFQVTMSVAASMDGNILMHFYDDTNSALIGAVGDAAGSRPRGSWVEFNSSTNASNQYTTGFLTWHEPGTTSSIDYTIWGAADDANTMYINKDSDGTDDNRLNNARPASTFTITEYAASTVTLT